MRKTKFISTILIFIFNLCSVYSFGQTLLPPKDSAYKLVWADSFNIPQLNVDKWSKTYGFHQSSNYNFNFCDQPGWVVETAAIKVWDTIGNPDTANCKINNGTLKLYTKKENYNGRCWTWPNCTLPNTGTNDLQCNVPGPYGQCQPNGTDTVCWRWDTLPFKFTTAVLVSNYKFRYGYFEWRFKLPQIPPLMPTPVNKTYQGHGGGFWLWSADNNTYNEIDGPEIDSYNPYSQKYFYASMNSHFSSNGNLRPANSDYAEYKNIYITPNVWHTSAINWTSNSIEYYLDDTIQYVSYNHPDSLLPMSIIMNLGGVYAPCDNYCHPFDTSTTGTFFPFIIETDYIKIWQLKKDCNNDTIIYSFNPSTYKNKLYNSIIMGANTNITNVYNQSFWGSDYVLLNPGTYIDANSHVLLNVTDCDKIGPPFKLTSLQNPRPPSKSELYKFSLHH